MMQYIVTKLSIHPPQPHFWIDKVVVFMQPKQVNDTKHQHELHLHSQNPTAHSPEPKAFASTSTKEQF